MAVELASTPLWERFPPPGKIEEVAPGKLFRRVFLPYSKTLTWINPGKHYDLDEQAYLTRELIPPEFANEDPAATNEKGVPMPGNITDKVYWAVNGCLPLKRLLQIHQLALLESPYERSDMVSASTIALFPQSRFTHDLLTARIVQLILQGNNFPEDVVNSETIPPLVHDLAIPPFGDATKSIDPEGLSEETNLERLLNLYNLSPLSRYGFDKAKTIQTVNGIGPAGQILDIADKLAYTAADAFSFTAQNKGEDSQISLDDYKLKLLLEKDPYWADIYQKVKLTEEGLPYFENATRLGHFLEIRALMHEQLYLNPKYRKWEMLYRTAIGNLYSRKPNPNFPLNSNNLILYTDHEMVNIINKYWKKILGPEATTWLFWNIPLGFKESSAENVAQMTNGANNEKHLVIATEEIGRFKTGVDFLTIDPKDGKIKPYKKVNPAHTQYLERISAESAKNVVYFLPNQFSDAELKRGVSLLVHASILRNSGTVPHYKLY